MDINYLIMQKGVKEMSNSIAHLLVSPFYKAKAKLYLDIAESMIQKYLETPNETQTYEEITSVLQKAYEYSIDERRLDVLLGFIHLNSCMSKPDFAQDYYELLIQQEFSEYSKRAMRRGWDDPTGFKSIYRFIKVLVGRGPTDEERIEQRINEFEAYKNEVCKKALGLLQNT